MSIVLSDDITLSMMRNGIDGKDGKDGKDGEKGDTGPQGPQGPQGNPGQDGQNGADGQNAIIYTLETNNPARRYARTSKSDGSNKQDIITYDISPENLGIQFFKIDGKNKENYASNNISVKYQTRGSIYSSTSNYLTPVTNGYSFNLYSFYNNIIVGALRDKTNSDSIDISVDGLISFYEGTNLLGSFEIKDAQPDEALKYLVTSANIQASIDNNAMVFDTTGLSLYKGAFTIYSTALNATSPDPVLYFDSEESDRKLVVKGKIKATSLEIIGPTVTGLSSSNLSDKDDLATAASLKTTNDAVATAQSKANQAHSLASDAALGVGEAKEDAAEAATKATNYLRFDDGVGLIVGNLLEKDANGKTTLTYNICIDSNSINFRKDTTIISSFNNEGLNLLNGAATLYCTDMGDGSEGYRGIFTIQSDSLTFISSDIITIWPNGGRNLIDLKGKVTVNNQIAISVNNNKKMVYGQCTDQSDGTSFVGGLFEKSDTSYPFTKGLVIGGSTGNLLWKGNIVATTDMIPSIPTSLKNPYSLTVKRNGTQAFVYDGSAGKTLNIREGDNVTISTNSSSDIIINSSYVNTTYSAGTGISLSGTTFSNSGVRSISTGSTNGTISVNTGGSSAEVAVKNCAVLGNGTNGIGRTEVVTITPYSDSTDIYTTTLNGTNGSRFYSNLGLTILQIGFAVKFTNRAASSQYFTIAKVSGHYPSVETALSINYGTSDSGRVYKARILPNGDIQLNVPTAISGVTQYINISGVFTG